MKTFVTFLSGLIVAAAVFFVGVHSVSVVPAPGAATGPDSFFPCESHNGATTCFNRKPLAVATTTICAIQSPTATSTLARHSGIVERVSSTTASTITFAKATTPYATTTLIGTQVTVAANAQVAVNASTTDVQVGAGVNVFAPSTWFVISQSGGTGTFSPSGFCHADFNVI